MQFEVISSSLALKIVQYPNILFHITYTGLGIYNHGCKGTKLTKLFDISPYQTKGICGSKQEVE
jgi:hypothetical protein